MGKSHKIPRVLSSSLLYQTMIVCKSWTIWPLPWVDQSSPAWMVGDQSWDLTPLAAMAFVIHTNKTVKADYFIIIGGKLGKTSKDSGIFSEPPYITPQAAVIGNMVDRLLRTAWAVRDEGWYHFEDWNRERNQFFMEILGFARAFENPQLNAVEKATHHSRRPEVWGCIGYKPTQHFINLGHVSQPARGAASSSAQSDGNTLPLLPHRTARDRECEGMTRAGKMPSTATRLVTLGTLIRQGQNLGPVTSSSL